MLVLRKVALFRLTALMEKHRTSLKNPSFIHWDLPKFIRRMKPPEYKDKRVFGVPLHVVLQRTGYPIPAAILAAMSFLRRDCVDAVGLFRKSGVRSRIEKLKHMCESEPEGDFSTAFDGQLVYDVGDMVKQYFRDLPEALLTNKLSETFLKIFLLCANDAYMFGAVQHADVPSFSRPTISSSAAYSMPYRHLPVECREEAVNAAILLMPDENRESLFTLLTFLDEIAYNSAKNQMNAANLAVCFAPSLFHLAGGHSSRSGSPSPARSRGGSPKLGAKETGVVGQQTCGMVMSGMPDQRDLMEQRAAHQCLAFLISNCRKLFTALTPIFEIMHKVKQNWDNPRLNALPLKLMSHCEFNYLEVSRPVGLDSLGLDVNGNWRTYMEACVTGLMKETKDGYSVSKYYRWVGLACGVPSVSVHFKKVGDGHPLRLWKISTECDAPPVNIMIRILKERPLWDHHLLKWKTIAKLDTDAEVLQMVSATMEPHPLNEFLVLRFWRGQLTTAGGCAVVETSVEHDAAPPLPGTVRGVVLASRFLIEPCGSGRSRVTHISRLDLKGHSVEWYNKNYGHVAASALSRLRESFQSCAEGPETKV
ncbi:unnamed protein product [Notodromas monacha]|uniref:Uncharacterized protein n=1 Tax=Notodromas monacha TaxID=399045 RepID=A0A7R9GJR3_9CRUS|nr:unnamed protein product [Notodromas monacha]CAG0923080.1 unnamed protein product [Notodromas monacha]